MTKLRRTTENDVSRVLEIVEQGKAYLKASGVDQWQNGYPNEAVIVQDITDGYAYVLEMDGEVVGTVALSFDGEPWYDDIDGAWLTEGDFLVVHRMAVHASVRGTDAASEILKAAGRLCEQRGVKSIKIDTHEGNVPMQKLVKKNGFSYCGTVILGREGKRLAFEKVLG